MFGALERVVDVPDVSAERVGGALKRPGEECQLATETSLVEQVRRGAQQRQVIGQSAQSVIATAVKHVTEGRLHHRHVLRQKVVLHLRKHTQVQREGLILCDQQNTKDIFTRCPEVIGRYIDAESILGFSECIEIPLQSSLSLDFNSRWRFNLVLSAH